MSVPNEDKYEKIIAIVNEGSGVIFQPITEDYSYILTAKHTLYEDKETMNTPILNHTLEVKCSNIEFIEKYEHNIWDIAILKIKKFTIENTPLKNISELDDKEYDLFGYPEYNRNGENNTLDNFKVTANKTQVNEVIIIFDEKDYSGQGIIEGVSGGGIFREKNGKIYLIAIEFEMNAPKENIRKDRRIKAVNIKAFDEIVEKYSDELVYLDDNKNIEKSKKNNTIKEIIPLKNGKSLTLEFVKVKLEDDKILYVGKYPVTFEEFDLFCNKTESVWGRGKNPIININWDDANLYCRWLTDNIKDNNIIFRLPTPEEWTEIATQNFSQDKFSQDNFSNKAKKVIDTEKGKLGIYGMYGNVHEWCYSEKCEEIKIVKGGSFRNSLQYISDVTKITKFLSEERNEEVSFRIIAEKIYNKNIQGE